MSEGNAQAEPIISVAPAEQVKINEQQQQRLQRYIRVATLYNLLLLLVAGLLLVPVIIFVVIPATFTIVTTAWLAFQPVPGWYPLRILAFYLMGTVAIGCLLFLFSLLVGYILPRHYKVRASTRTFAAWLRRWLRINGRRLLHWLLVLQSCLLCIAIQPNLWWLWMALLFTCIATLQTYLSPLYAFRGVKRTPLTDERLVNVLNTLCKANKTNIQHFFLLESKKPGQLVRANAYLAGWGKTSSILLTDGLLKYFQHTEIKSVVAHELGHHVHRHLIKRQLLNFGLLLAELFLYYMGYHWFQFLVSSSSSPSNAEVIALLFFGCLAVCLRLSFWQARRGYRRKNEFWADEFALRATYDVQAFKNAMLRLGNLNDIPLKLTPRQEKGQTHPSTMSRLQHADEFAIRLAQARRVT